MQWLKNSKISQTKSKNKIILNITFTACNTYTYTCKALFDIILFFIRYYNVRNPTLFSSKNLRLLRTIQALQDVFYRSKEKVIDDILIVLSLKFMGVNCHYFTFPPCKKATNNGNF